MSGGKPLAFFSAHKGPCDVAWLGGSLVTCGADGRVCWRAGGQPAEVTTQVDGSNNGAATALTCIHASPKDDRLAVADDQCYVKVGGGGDVAGCLEALAS